MDRVLAATLLCFASPFLLGAMLLVKLTSRGPALYSQVRVGLNGELFKLYKVRSMRQDAERLTGPQWSGDGDPRITTVGRILRKLHIDELPQLWNVLRGEMSLIGPRPERPEFVPQLTNAIAGYRTRLLMRPGLTGLAQVQLPPDSNLDSVRIKLAYDIHYIRCANVWLDIKLLAATALKIVHTRFEIIRRVLRLPRQMTVQREYHELVDFLND